MGFLVSVLVRDPDRWVAFLVICWLIARGREEVKKVGVLWGASDGLIDRPREGRSEDYWTSTLGNLWWADRLTDQPTMLKMILYGTPAGRKKSFVHTVGAWVTGVSTLGPCSAIIDFCYYSWGLSDSLQAVSLPWDCSLLRGWIVVDGRLLGTLSSAKKVTQSISVWMSKWLSVKCMASVMALPTLNKTFGFRGSSSLELLPLFPRKETYCKH